MYYFTEGKFGLKTLINHLKARTNELTAEIATWTKEFTVKLKDVRTRLEISKHKSNETNLVINDYEELFEDGKQSPDRNVLDSEAVSQRKMLLKGRTGKTSMTKRIASNWARGVFKAFAIVFFISMKLVDPGEVLRNIIIDQNSLGDLKITRENLKDIFDQIGDDCLLIIDGIDDHTGCVNKDVLRIIKEEKVFCNLLVTFSGLNGVRTLDQYFDTVCKVQGLQENDVQYFAEKLGEREKDIMSKCMPSELARQHIMTSSDPLLIVLLCTVESNKTGFSENEPLGNLSSPYGIYVQTCKWRTRSFDTSTKLSFLKRIGKLALNIWRFGKVSTDADIPPVSCGFFVKSKASLVSFVHSSFQVFLAALYFLLILDDGSSVESLLGTDCQRPVFMVNSMFLYFCLSLLTDEHFLPLKNAKNIGIRLQNYILERIDCVQLELSCVREVYPALNVSSDSDEMVLKFLLQTLSRCQNVKDLILAPNLSVKRILSEFKSKYQSLNSIRLVSDDDEISVDVVSTFDAGDLSVIIHNESGQCVDDLLEFVDTIDREFSIYFLGGNRSKPMIDLSTLLRPNARRLYIRSSQKSDKSYLTVKQDTPLCTKLTHLLLPESYCMVGEETVEVLSKAVQNGRFPNLKHLTMHDSSLKLSKLFVSGCASLRELNSKDTLKEEEDKNCLKRLLPQLESLFVNGSSFASQFSELQMPNMTCLKIRNTDLILEKDLEGSTFPNLSKLDITWFFDRFAEVLDRWKVKSLTDLSLAGQNYDSRTFLLLSQSEVVQNLHHLSITDFKVEGRLFCLFSGRTGFQHLKSLALRDGLVRSQDLRTLAQASVDGLLPSLIHLDVSSNPKMGSLRHLFEFGCKWEKLKVLNVDGKHRSGSNRDRAFADFKILTLQAQSGCLQVLEKLYFYAASHDFIPNLNNTSWRRLNILEISFFKDLNQKQILKPLVTAVEQGFLPALESVTLCGGFNVGNSSCRQRVSVSNEKQRLRVKGVSVYFVTRDDSW